jgi:5-methylcytosine-specific restriction protein A
VPDHIVPLALGGDDTDANTRSLCTPCHGARTREQFGLKKKVAITVSGWPET